MIARKLYYLLKSFKSKQRDSREMEEFKASLLNQLLEFTESNSTFYSKLWSQEGFNPKEIEIPADLEKAPIVEKEDIRQNMAEVETNLNEAKTYSSSGTTGNMASIAFDEQAADWREAITLRTEFMKGYSVLNSVAGNWGMPVTRIGKLLRPSTEIQEESSLEEQANTIRESNPDYLVYGGHVLFRVARKMKLGDGFDGDIEGIFNNGELLTPNMQDTIEEVFDTEIYSVYETAEVGQIARECPEGGYHINEDLVIAEILDDNEEEVDPGESGSLVVTGLVNRSTPLVRYRIGDRVMKGRNNCSCQTNFSKIERIEGREDDIVTGEEGEEICPQDIINTLAEFEGLEKFLFIKTGTGHRIEYTPNKLFSEETEEEIEKRFSDLGLPHVEVEEVESIKRSGRKAKPIRSQR